MSEHLEITYHRWFDSIERLENVVRELDYDREGTQIYTYVAGRSFFSRCLDIGCYVSGCTDLILTLIFPHEGNFTVPIPDGFKVEEFVLDFSSEEEDESNRLEKD